MTSYEPVIKYAYHVDGREYQNTRVNFGARVSSVSKEIAEQRAARYPEGTKVVVHYDPAHASVSVIETGVAFEPRTILFAVIFLCLTLFFWGVRP